MALRLSLQRSAAQLRQARPAPWRALASDPNAYANAKSTAEQLHAKYESDAAIEFYRVVMGGGDGNIHYGLSLLPEGQETVAQSAQNTVDFMGDLMRVTMKGELGEQSKLMDLGSGHGGAAHSIIQRFGCHITGYNLGSVQNEHAEAEARKLGLGDKFTTRVGNFDEEGLPEEWTEQFDAVWSEEVFCHSSDKRKLLGEVYRVLKPGGTLIFSDIMAGEEATAEDVATFTDRNATSVMYRPSDYIAALTQEKFTFRGFVDFSDHLASFQQRMVHNIDANLASLKEKGVAEQHAQDFRLALTERIDACARNSFAWGAFAATKSARVGANPLLRSGFASGTSEGVVSHGKSGRAFSTVREISPMALHQFCNGPDRKNVS